MSGKLFGQIVLLMLIGIILTLGVKCLHKNLCQKCPSWAAKCDMTTAK